MRTSQKVLIALLLLGIVLVSGCVQQQDLTANQIRITDVNWDKSGVLQLGEITGTTIEQPLAGIYISVNDLRAVQKIYVDDQAVTEFAQEKITPYDYERNIINTIFFESCANCGGTFRIDSNHIIKVCSDKTCDTKELSYLSQPSITIDYVGMQGVDATVNLNVSPCYSQWFSAEFKINPFVCSLGKVYIKDNTGTWKEPEQVSYENKSTCDVATRYVNGCISEMLVVDGSNWGYLKIS